MKAITKHKSSALDLMQHNSASVPIQSPTDMDPHMAWRNRVAAATAHKYHNKRTVWLLTPKRSLVPVVIKDISCIRTLMFASDERELLDYYKWSLDPLDCDQRIFEHNNRAVYMAWKALDQSTDKNINIPATRILVHHQMVDPPAIEIVQDDLLNYTHCFPSDHVVLYNVVHGKLVDYPIRQLQADWVHMTNSGPHAYRVLAKNRYQHFSQALAEYEQTGAVNGFVTLIINKYLRTRVGGVLVWNAAQITVLAAAVYMMCTRDWDDTIHFPRVHKLM